MVAGNVLSVHKRHPKRQQASCMKSVSGRLGVIFWCCVALRLQFGLWSFTLLLLACGPSRLPTSPSAASPSPGTSETRPDHVAILSWRHAATHTLFSHESDAVTVSLLLPVRSRDHQHQHRLGPCEKCTLLDSSPGRLDQNMCIFTRSQRHFPAQ